MLVKAYAKINHFLRVLDKRPDGYHNLETVYQTISLADTLELSRDSGLSSVGFSLAANSAFPVPVDEQNLVLRAIRLAENAAARKLSGLRIILNKQIPVGAGLGGGSTDAAATLLAVNQLFSLELSLGRLLSLAAELGADVPFFLQGGTALGQGRGELISPLANSSRFYVVLVFPGFPIKTVEAYRSLDESRHGANKQPARQLQGIISALSSGTVDALCRCLNNDFSDTAEISYPELKSLRLAMLSAGCQGVQLSGSGSAVFGICRTLSQAHRTQELMKGSYEHVFVCEPTSHGQDFEGQASF